MWQNLYCELLAKAFSHSLFHTAEKCYKMKTKRRRKSWRDDCKQENYAIEFINNAK